MDSNSRIRNINSYLSRKYKTKNPTDEQLTFLKSLLPKTEKDFSDKTDLIPIRLVTIIEVFVKDWGEMLIDNINSDIRDRAANLKNQIKYDYIVTSAIYNGHISLGHLIANDIKINSLENVLSIFSILLDCKFKDRIASAKRWVDNDKQLERELIVTDIDLILATINKLFETRHILVHEMPHKKPYTYKDAFEFLEHSELFLEALTEALKPSLWWHSNAENVNEMHNHLDNQIKDLNQKISDILERVRSELNGPCEALEINERMWNEFLKSHCDLFTSSLEGWWEEMERKLHIIDLLEMRLWALIEKAPEKHYLPKVYDVNKSR